MVEITAPGFPVKGSVMLPTSKSLSNRHLILNHLTGNKTTLRRISEAEDTKILQSALHIISSGSGQLIDIGHAGTDFRFLTALLAFTEGDHILTGSERMQERPIAGLVNALKQLNAEISYLEKEGYPPLKIHGKKTRGGTVSLDASTSSQFVSALMLAYPLLKDKLTINLTGKMVSAPYVNMTIRVLEQYGIIVHRMGNTYHLSGEIETPKKEIEIEGDWTSASYYFSVCALAGGSNIVLDHLSKDSLQGDAILPAIYSMLGVRTSFIGNSVQLNNIPPADGPFIYDFTDCPDLAQTVAVTCAALGKKAHLTGLATLRIKETDRISALAAELEKFGTRVTSSSDSLELEAGHLMPSDKVITTYGDHRMAMSFAPLSLRLKSIKMEDPKVVIKSYPRFWDDLRALGFNVNLQP